jgi:hypothetical protein
MVKIDCYFYNFNNKKSGPVEIVVVKFELTKKILEFLGWSWSNLN